MLRTFRLWKAWFYGTPIGAWQHIPPAGDRAWRILSSGDIEFRPLTEKEAAEAENDVVESVSRGRW